MRFLGRLPALFAGAIFLLCAGNALAGAAPASLVVNTVEDVVDPNDTIAEGSITAKVSLREAIIEANGTGGASTITFDSGVFGAKAEAGNAETGTRTITLNGTELPVIEGALTIAGPTENQVIIDADGESRIFSIDPAATVTLSNLRLTGGNTANSTIGQGNGGAIYNQGNLTLLACTISGNTATGNDATQGGGAIYHASTGNLNIGDGSAANACTIANNAATGTSGSGGAIFNNGGTLTINRATLSSNSAPRAGGAVESLGDSAQNNFTFTNLNGNRAATISGTAANPGNGGGIHVTGAGSVSFSRSSAVGNLAADEGGALWASNSGTMTITASTLSGNQAVTGGAVFADQGDTPPTCTSNTLTIEHATIASNTASEENGGGGLFAEAMCEPVIDNSIFANNTANSVDNDVQATLANIDNSLIEARNVTTNNGNDATIVTDDPNLAARSTDPVSGTQVHRLNAATVDSDTSDTVDDSTTSSVALDALDNTLCLTGDQRNFTQDFDFDESGGTANCDLGAFEINTNMFASFTSPTGYNGITTEVVQDGTADSDTVLLGVEVSSVLLDETDRTSNGGNSTSRTVDITRLEGTILEGNISLLPSLTAIKVYRDTDNDGDLTTGSQVQVFSTSDPESLITNANTGAFAIDLPSNAALTINADDPDDDTDGNDIAFLVITADIADPVVLSAALFGLPIIALAFLQRRRSLRLLLIAAGFSTLLLGCGSDNPAEDIEDPEANNTQRVTFRISLTNVTVVDNGSGNQEVLQNIPAPSIIGRLLAATVPK